MERQGNTMSGAYIEKNRTGAKPPVNHPQNCKEECPYGYDKAFCFPCYKKLMEEVSGIEFKDKEAVLEWDVSR